jgi:periplasmic divalent cation tolerance protein
MTADLLRVTTATPDQDSARALARSAVAAHLAGNAQIIGPVVSVFRHLGKTGESEEYQLVLSTTTIAYPALEAHLIEHHPWKNPEITAVPLAAAPQPYARWLRESTAPQD